MTWVKICGTTNVDDALVAVDAGADAVGFVFYERSPRYVTVEKAREICEKLPESMEKVGVFVGSSVDDWASIVLSAGLTGAQQYVALEANQGSHRAIGIDILPKSFRSLTALPVGQLLESGASAESIADNFEHLMDNASAIPSALKSLMDTFVLDSGGSQGPGGTGRTFDWSKAKVISEGMRRGGLKMVLAGGLTPQNVDEAISTLHPWGVDVVSGVEASPGKKDPEKVRAFVRAVREMDRRVG